MLGSGFNIVDTGKTRIVRSVPLELSVDHTKALSACNEKGFISASVLQDRFNWDIRRTQDTLSYLLDHEIAWLDTQTSEPTYWILGLVAGSSSQT